MVFDWDNTLVDSWPMITEAINKARVQFGLSAWSRAEIIKNCTRAARDSFPEWFGDRWKEAYDFYYKAFDELRKSEHISVMPGAQELLKWLQQQKIPCYVVSNKRGDYLRHEADRLDWKKYFIAIIGAGDATRDKPSRDHVDHALKHGGHEAHESVWFVGDSEADIQCALNSGCTPVLIGEPEEAKRMGASLVFPDCQALQTLLYNQLNQQ